MSIFGTGVNVLCSDVNVTDPSSLMIVSARRIWSEVEVVKAEIDELDGQHAPGQVAFIGVIYPGRSNEIDPLWCEAAGQSHGCTESTCGVRRLHVKASDRDAVRSKLEELGYIDGFIEPEDY